MKDISELIILCLGIFGVLFGLWNRNKIQKASSVTEKYRISKELKDVEIEMGKKDTVDLVNLANKRFPGSKDNSN